MSLQNLELVERGATGKTKAVLDRGRQINQAHAGITLSDALRTRIPKPITTFERGVLTVAENVLKLVSRPTLPGAVKYDIHTRRQIIRAKLAGLKGA